MIFKDLMIIPIMLLKGSWKNFLYKSVKRLQQSMVTLANILLFLWVKSLIKLNL